jgi:shikimate kinase
MKTSIALIGFMGTGKTAVGKLLAEKLDKDFVELDSLVEKKAGKSISAIFNGEGEIAFRELEIAVTREVAGRKNAVIACGGGIVLNQINIDRLRQECVVVCLAASPEVILKRTSVDRDGRPLLAVADRARRVKELLAFRRPYYARSADITVNTSRLKVDTIVSRIIEKVKEHESSNK